MVIQNYLLSITLSLVVGLVGFVAAYKIFDWLTPGVEFKDQLNQGNLVFFDDLGHVGIVEDEDSFYHSATSKGTSRGTFPGYWDRLVTGYRSLEGLEPAPPKPVKKKR